MRSIPPPATPYIARAVSLLALALIVCSHSLAQESGVIVRTVADSIEGGVGGVAVDRAGDIYVADFGDNVWKVKPDGRLSLFATGFYGSSGNTIDRHGRLFQSSFYGNYISVVDRLGNQDLYVSDGLQGPVGLVFDSVGSLFVNNCTNNTISRVSVDREVEIFAESPLLNCPNGITIDPDDNLYVVNFRDGKLLKVTPEGDVSELAVLPGGGNGHVTFARGALVATSFRGQRVYRVELSGVVELLAGTGAIGEADGNGAEATFSWPNGIAASPSGDRVYVNDYVNRFPPTITSPPVPVSSLRMVKLASIADLLANALISGGIEGMTETYRAFKADPATSSTYTETDLNRLGYELMGRGQMPAAIAIFRLNSESYPDSFNVFDSLAEALMNAGNAKEAIANYRKSLEINPANANALQMIRKLEGE